MPIYFMSIKSQMAEPNRAVFPVLGHFKSYWAGSL